MLRNKDQLPARPLSHSSGWTYAPSRNLVFLHFHWTFGRHVADIEMLTTIERLAAGKGTGTRTTPSILEHFVSRLQLNEKIIFRKDRPASHKDVYHLLQDVLMSGTKIDRPSRVCSELSTLQRICDIPKRFYSLQPLQSPFLLTQIYRMQKISPTRSQKMCNSRREFSIISR